MRPRGIGILAQNNITLNELVEKIYEETEIDHDIFDLELSYMPSSHSMFKIPPLVINSNRGLQCFMSDLIGDKNQRPLLCVTLVRKLDIVCGKDNNADNNYAEEEEDDDDDGHDKDDDKDEDEDEDEEDGNNDNGNSYIQDAHPIIDTPILDNENTL